MAKGSLKEVEVKHSGTPDLVPFEINLEEALLFGGGGEDGEVVEFTLTLQTAEGGQIDRTWRLRANPEYGWPDTFDEDIWVAIHKLVQLRGGMQVDGKLGFSLYEIISILGLPKKGENYRNVRKAILRIGKLQIDFFNSHYSKEELRYGSEHYSPWRVHFEANADKFGRASEQHTITFDETLARSFRSGYIKHLDIDFYYALDHPYSKRLYRRLDINRGDSLRWSIKLDALRQLLSMPKSYRYPSKVKEKLGRAHEELLRKGYLKSIKFPERDVVCYEVSEEFVEERVALERPWSQEESAAVRTLIRNGVWANVARTLVYECGPELCNYYVNALPYQKGVRNSGAWLKKYINEKLPLPIEPPQKRLDDPDLAPAGNEREANQWPPPPDSGAKELWERVIDDLSGQMNGSTFHVWFEGTVPTALERDILTLTVPNSLAKEYIEGRFGELIESLLKKRLSERASLLVVVDSANQ
jgi:Replication initiator protein A/DnaA N-terminal domain